MWWIISRLLARLIVREKENGKGGGLEGDPFCFGGGGGVHEKPRENKNQPPAGPGHTFALPVVRKD